MDELRGPTIQIVLHIREGLGFGFLKNPFFVSGSLNGYVLETDTAVPCHAPIFDSELVWEADKRRFRNLRVQNVPIKIEVHATSTQGRKDKVGYLLLSLLSAQPRPANKVVNVKNAWHRLLGVKAEGKCCHPQLLLSLTIEDRISTPTPRNELRMFHSNEVAFLTNYPDGAKSTMRSTLQTYNEYIIESKKLVSSPDLEPKLICEEGIITIGDDSQHLFILSFVIGTAENVDLLLPELDNAKGSADAYVTYSVFTHNIMTDRVPASVNRGQGSNASFNQRTSLRLCTDLGKLSRYFSECPYVVTKLCCQDKDVGICSMDLRKLVPTESVKHFLDSFCNADQALTINERCYILCSEEYNHRKDDRRKPFIDIEISLKYIGVKKSDELQKSTLTARSASQLPTAKEEDKVLQLDFRSESCTQLEQDTGSVAYTNITARNTNRYKNAAGDASLQSNEITDIIKKMCDSFAMSQERLLASTAKPTTSDMQIQCEPVDVAPESTNNDRCVDEVDKKCEVIESSNYDVPDTNIDKERIKQVISITEREVLMQKYTEELEDWKEKHQDLYKCQLQRKEEYHLELLAKEWAKKRVDLESKLSRGIDQCRNLAADLSRATDDFRLRGFRNTERERKLADAKTSLEAHYTAKYQELREASQKMEDDMNHRLKLKDMRIEELDTKVQQLEKQLEIVKNNLRATEKEAESKYSGLTKDQTASLIQELRCLEEKVDNAMQSKAFFKEQWGRAVRELHFTKLNNRKQMLSQLHQDRKELGDIGLDTIQDQEEEVQDEIKINKLKDDFYVDLLANTPALESHSMLNEGSIHGSIDMFSELKNSSKNSMNERLNQLMKQRDNLITECSPDEERITQLNQEIRNMLLNYGT